jgi:hypothetical protein
LLFFLFVGFLLFPPLSCLGAVCGCEGSIVHNDVGRIPGVPVDDANVGVRSVRESVLFMVAMLSVICQQQHHILMKRTKGGRR